MRKATVYIAKDGSRWDDEEDCLAWEHKIDWVEKMIKTNPHGPLGDGWDEQSSWMPMVHWLLDNKDAVLKLLKVKAK